MARVENAVHDEHKLLKVVHLVSHFEREPYVSIAHVSLFKPDGNAFLVNPRPSDLHIRLRH